MRIREGLNFRIRFCVEEKSKVGTKKLGFVDTSEKKRINRHTIYVKITYPTKIQNLRKFTYNKRTYIEDFYSTLELTGTVYFE
jgi:hypothetical protein